MYYLFSFTNYYLGRWEGQLVLKLRNMVTCSMKGYQITFHYLPENIFLGPCRLWHQRSSKQMKIQGIAGVGWNSAGKSRWVWGLWRTGQSQLCFLGLPMLVCGKQTMNDGPRVLHGGIVGRYSVAAGVLGCTVVWGLPILTAVQGQTWNGKLVKSTDDNHSG